MVCFVNARAAILGITPQIDTIDVGIIVNRLQRAVIRERAVVATVNVRGYVK
jgi:hypothetical protein